MSAVHVAGAAMTQFGKGGALLALTEEAAAAALQDAGVLPRDVEQVY